MCKGSLCSETNRLETDDGPGGGETCIEYSPGKRISRSILRRPGGMRDLENCCMRLIAVGRFLWKVVDGEPNEICRSSGGGGRCYRRVMG